MHYQLTADVCSKQISDVHLEKISRSHCKDWRRLPPHLEIETIVASDIDRYQVGKDEKRREFFFCWNRGKAMELLICISLALEDREQTRCRKCLQIVTTLNVRWAVVWPSRQIRYGRVN